MKRIRFNISLLAFLVAIGLAGSSVRANGTAILVRVHVSLPSPAPCAHIGYCETGGTTVCKTPGGTTVREYFPATGTCGFAILGIWDED